MDGIVIQGSVESINTRAILDSASSLIIQKSDSVFKSYHNKKLHNLNLISIELFFLMLDNYANVFNIYGHVDVRAGSFLVYGNVTIQIVKPVRFDVNTNYLFLGNVEFVNVGNPLNGIQ